MSVLSNVTTLAGRARYAAAQGLRSAWYGGNYALARRRAGGFTRPGEAAFRPESGPPDFQALRNAFFELFRQDLANVEAGLYPPPNDVRLTDLLGAVRSAAAFQADVPKVDRRRMARDGAEVRSSDAADPDRFPTYYRQNFHYQTDGWLSDESAALYDTQVETLFTGAADAMRRAALAEIARELRGRDQRDVALLDVAGGTGRFLAQVLRAYPKLNAAMLDLSPNYCAAAREKLSAWPRAEVIEGAAEALPIEDESQDIIVSIYLFHELPPRVRPQVFAEMARVLKPGGLFVFADSLQFGDAPDLDGLLEYFPEGFHEPYYKGYLKADLDAQLTEAGLVKERKTNAFLTKVMTWRKAG